MTNQIFSTIKNQVSLVEVVSHYTTLKQAGIYFKGHCPFHQERTGSFTITPHLHIFYCFGCHESGDVISFIAKIENCSQWEAVKQLAEKYNIPLEISTASQTIKTSAEKYQAICTLFTQWCRTNLRQSSGAKTYIESRGFTKKTIDEFEVGYFPGGLGNMKQFIAFAQKKAVLATDLIEAGIIMQSKQTIYSPFEERIIFPIKNHLNSYNGFGGRIFKAQDERPKYYNSKEHEFFNKSNILFGLNLARTAIQQTGTAFLVEGYTDCMAMAQMGYQNTVATLGTACTQQHLKIIARYAHELIIVYDNDQAGDKGIQKIAQLCWHANIQPKVVRLASGKDPAQMLQNKAVFEENIGKAEDIFVFLIKQIAHNYTSLSLQDRMHNVGMIIDLIKTIDDTLKQNILLQHASERLDIPFALLLEKTNKQPTLLSQQIPPVIDKDTKTPLSCITKESFSIEKKILSAVASNFRLIHDPRLERLVTYLPSTLSIVLLQLKEWIKINGYDQRRFEDFFESRSADIKEYISIIISSAEESSEEDFSILLNLLQKKWWKKIMHHFKEKITQAQRQGNTSLINRLMNEFTVLQKSMIS